MFRIYKIRENDVHEMIEIADEICCLCDELKHVRKKFNRGEYDYNERDDEMMEDEMYEKGIDRRGGSFGERNHSRYMPEDYDEESWRMNHRMNNRYSRRMNNRASYRA